MCNLLKRLIHLKPKYPWHIVIQRIFPMYDSLDQPKRELLNHCVCLILKSQIRPEWLLFVYL